MDAYTAPGVLPEGVLLTCSTGVYGHSVSKHLFAMLLALMKRLPQYRDQQRQAQWRDLGQARSLLDAEHRAEPVHVLGPHGQHCGDPEAGG